MVYPEQMNISSELPSHQWQLINVTERRNTYIDLGYYVGNRATSNYSSMIICVILKRDPAYYVTTLIIPSTLMCVMAFGTFCAPPDSGERISLGISMILGLTVFQLLAAEILPTASKESPIIYTYMITTFALSCLAIPFSLLNLNIAYGDTFSSLKTPWLKRAFLEVLPSCLFVMTYDQRVQEELPGVTQIPPLQNLTQDANSGTRRVKTYQPSITENGKKLSEPSVSLRKMNEFGKVSLLSYFRQSFQ